MCFGSGGVGTSRLASCSTRNATACGLGPLVHAVERGQPAVGEVAGHLLVGEDHQLLDQPVRLGLLLVAHARHVALASRTRTRARASRPRARRAASRSARATPRARPRAASAQGSSARARARRRSSSTCAVGEPRVAADHASGGRPTLRDSAPSISISTVTASRSSPGRRLQASVGEHLRQHRLDRARHVDAGRRAGRPRARAARRAARRRSRRRCAPTRGRGRSSRRAEIGVVEVAGVVGVDREGRQLGAGRRGRRPRRARRRRARPRRRRARG